MELRAWKRPTGSQWTRWTMGMTVCRLGSKRRLSHARSLSTHVGYIYWLDWQGSETGKPQSRWDLNRTEAPPLACSLTSLSPDRLACVLLGPACLCLCFVTLCSGPGPPTTTFVMHVYTCTYMHKHTCTSTRAQCTNVHEHTHRCMCAHLPTHAYTQRPHAHAHTSIQRASLSSLS